MLILSREQGERIVLGGGIRVTVLSLRRGRVRLGIEAPDEIAVLRQELVSRDRLPADGPDRQAPQPPANPKE
jgi:carbon storage regulator